MAPSANIGVEEPDPLLRLEERFGEREEELRFLAAIVCFLSESQQEDTTASSFAFRYRNVQTERVRPPSTRRFCPVI
ncbi:hypothetical protein C088_00640 [Brucella abortus 65/110]|nr:hypothetical protein C088_00640 [Brucella abortus 65/110]